MDKQSELPIIWQVSKSPIVLETKKSESVNSARIFMPKAVVTSGRLQIAF